MNTPPAHEGLSDASLIKGQGSDIMFVRSQSQLAIDNPAAKGHRLTRIEAEIAFGCELVERVLEDGVVSLVTNYSEPATTLMTRREQLGLSLEEIAKAAHVSEQIVADAETPGKIVAIQALNEICQVLALNESVLSHIPTAFGDDELGVRLRLLSDNNDERSFSASTVVKLTEAAWVVAKQSALAENIGLHVHHLASSRSPKNGNYSYPAFEKGYQLAEETRRLLGLNEEDSIPSVRLLVEETLKIPLIQTRLDARFAGATIANGAYRGIIVNERGRNSDAAVRRMTMCHELAHLLWDPDEKLDRVLVDEYDGIEGGARTTDAVEIRANSFAVSFLAPRKGVQRIVDSASSIGDAIKEVSLHYGISVSAARYHIFNICKLETRNALVGEVDLSDWLSAENLTVDYLPGVEIDTPICRRGMFSGIVAKAFLEEKISEDTARICLRSKEITTDAMAEIAIIWGL